MPITDALNQAREILLKHGFEALNYRRYRKNRGTVLISCPVDRDDEAHLIPCDGDKVYATLVCKTTAELNKAVEMLGILAHYQVI